MINQLSWKVGGQQGEGIESTGEIFAIALNRLGYYLYGYRHFSSRIKGGHTNNKIRVSTRPSSSISDDLDVLVHLIKKPLMSMFMNYHSVESSLPIASLILPYQKELMVSYLSFLLPKLLTI